MAVFIMMNNIDCLYSLEFIVRDYECDLQGIVNNACYMHYFEHTRHQYFNKIGLDFAQLHRQEIDPVVVRVELDYMHPLTSGNQFIVRLWIEKKNRTKIVFRQDIVKIPGEKLVCKAMFEGAVLKQGKPVKVDFIMDMIPHKNTGEGE